MSESHAPVSPWMNATRAGVYLGGKSRRFILDKVKKGEIRAARIGGRGEILTRTEWLDEFVERQTMPVIVRPLRMAR